MQQRTVQDQINAVLTGGVQPALLEGPLYSIVRDWRHLLLGWAPNRAQNFDFPTERFGQCAKEADIRFMIPGKCVAGGRSGYSVRLLSRDHLRGVWNVGGAGEAPGPILNPPGEGW